MMDISDLMKARTAPVKTAAGTVYVRVISGDAMERIAKESGDDVGIKSAALMVVEALCDEHGAGLIKGGIEQAMNLPMDVLQKVAEAAMEHNGLGEEKKT